MSERINYVLIDHENVQPADLDMLQLGPFKIKLFLGPGQNKLSTTLAISMQRLGDDAEYIQVATAGKNALDFHLSFYIGQLSARQPTAFFHIISKDGGFDPLIQHLRARGIAAHRCDSIAAIPLFKALKSSPSAPPSTPQPAQRPQPPKHPADATPAVVIYQASDPLEAQVHKAISNLKNRPSGKPASEKTLLNSLHTLFARQLNQSELQKLYGELTRRGIVRVNGGKLSYQL